MNINITLDILKKESNDIILFHSVLGKDSIVLMDLLYKKGFNVIPIFQYHVKGLDIVENRINYFENKYKVRFIQLPHYCLSSHIRIGYMGIAKDEKQKIIKLSDIIKSAQNITNIDWVVLGFKKNDGIDRRIMLNEFEKDFYINFKNKKAFPLADWKNKDCYAYIEQNNLIKPFVYNQKKPSSDIELRDIHFLSYMKNNHKEDLDKIINQFPEVEHLLYAYGIKN